MTETHIFCISLEAERERRLHAITELKKTGLSWELIDAIDGRKGWGDMKADPSRWGPGLKPTEAGCYFSHMKALQRILDYDLPHAIIVEDDFGLELGVRMGMQEVIKRAPKGWNHIQLHGTGRDWNPNYKRIEKRGEFWLCDETTLLTLGYCVTKKFAKIITEKHALMTMPIDHLFARLSHWPAAQFYEVDSPIIGPRPFGSVICP